MYLDKFYTNNKTAESLLDILTKYTDLTGKTVLEPAAGDGSLIKPLLLSPETLVYAYDISPDVSYIREADFLRLPTRDVDIVIANPPFGKNSSLAIKFFNRCALWNPEYMAMIVPRTFNKPRFWSKLSEGYSLIESANCGKNSFLVDGIPYDVPCCMQIWKNIQRSISLPTELLLFEEVPPKESRLFVRRAGGRAGKIVEGYTPSSTYCIKDSPSVRELLNCNEKKFNAFASNTAGVKSITLLEMEDIIYGRYA